MTHCHLMHILGLFKPEEIESACHFRSAFLLSKSLIMKPQVVVSLLLKRFGSTGEPDRPTREDQRYADFFASILERGGPLGEIYEHTTLDVDKDEPGLYSWCIPHDTGYDLLEDPSDKDKTTKPCLDESYVPTPEKLPNRQEKFTDEELERWYRFWTRQPLEGSELRIGLLPGQSHCSDQQMQRRFGKCVCSKSTLKRYERKLKYGSPVQIMSKINEWVMNRFTEARSKHYTVHDQTIRSWGMQAKAELDPEEIVSFNASGSWCKRVKKRFRIVSRTITHRVSRNFSSEEEGIKKVANEFVHTTNDDIRRLNLPPCLVLNFDQTSCKKEAHPGRTLTWKNEKQVLGTVGSKTAITHANCAYLGASMAGDLLEPMYVLVSEPSGEFPASFYKDFKVPPNLVVFPGKTPNMNRNDLYDFLKSAFWPSVGAMMDRADQKEILVMLDSWTCNKNPKPFDDTCPEGVTCHRAIIPPRTTGLVQPLDVGFFRPYKQFIKHITDTVIVNYENVKIWSRENFLHLHSFAHYTFSAPRFRPLIQNCFYQAGFLIEHPAPFVTPVDFCFYLKGVKECCSVEGCNSFVFCRCAHCEEFLCLHHTLIKLHIYYCPDSKYRI